jgi:Tfp pilus assembly protein PilO
MQESSDKNQVRRARITAIFLALSIVIVLVTLVYAYTLSNKVERLTRETDEVKILAERYRLEAEQVAAEAEMKLARALKALDDCVANTK